MNPAHSSPHALPPGSVGPTARSKSSSGEWKEDLIMGAMLLLVVSVLALVAWRAAHEITELQRTMTGPERLADADP